MVRVKGGTMRWDFPSQDDRVETSAREGTIRKIDAWWEAFARREGDLNALFARRKEWDLPAWMEKHLQGINESMMWEFGEAIGHKGHRLVITPESKRTLRPLARAILRRAPKLAGWEFYPHRLAEDIAGTKATVKARVGLELEGMRVAVSVGAARRIDLLFESPACSAPNEGRAHHAAFVAAETLLGEEVLDEWIGAIDVQPVTRVGAIGKLLGRGKSENRFVPLERLKPTVDALIGSMMEQLPEHPFFEETPVESGDDENDHRRWSAFELKPAKAEDYAGWDDLMVGISPCQEVWSAAHSDAGFYSKRFSRFGERFCYLKIDGSQAEGMIFADRSEIEDALNAALVPERGGCSIGGGTGLRYSYVELALIDPAKAIGTIRRVLQGGKAPKRSWLLFHDCEWGEEWMGIWPHTPAPPTNDGGG
jgi:hypothetical protein